MLDRLCRARKEDKDKEEQRGRARLQEQVGEDGDDLRVEQARRPEAGALRAAQAVRRAPDAHAHLRPLAREACGHAREAAAAAELRLPAPAAPGRASPVEAYPVRSQSKTCSQCPCLPLQLDSAHRPSRHARHWDHLNRCACTDACAATPTQLPRPTAARMHIGARRPDKHSSGQDMHVHRVAALLLQSCYKDSHARAPALPLLLLDLAALVQVERGKRQVDHHRHRQAQAARRPPRHD